jgi:hypothetical protein
MDEAVAEPNDAKRMQVFSGMMKVLFDDAMALPMWMAKEPTAMSKSLQGDIQWGVGHPNFFEPQNVWLIK